MAESWEFDGNNVTFHLNKNAKWQDGTPLTAKDVEFTFLATAAPKMAATNYAYPSIKGLVKGMDEYKEGKADTISGIKIIDDNTIEFEMTQPYRDAFLMSVGVPTILPYHILKDVPPDEYGGEGAQTGLCKTDWGTTTSTGLGPFIVSRYVPNEVVDI